LTFEEDLKRLESFIGHEKAIRLLRVYQMEDADGRRDMEAAIQIQVERQLGVTPLSPDQALSLPQASQAAGPYVLGTVMAGDRPLYPFGVREDEFIQHMAIFGRSGAGKTNTIALLLRELVCHEVPFMIFDWKRNYRDCLAQPIPIPMEVYTVGRPIHPLRFNPLIPPPGTDIKIWLKKLIEIVSHAYYLGEGVVFLLLEALDHLYESFGCYSSPNPTQYPTMTDVLKHLQETRVTGRKAMWMDSTLRAVQSLCFGQISDVINVSRNDSIMDLLDKNVCLELNSLGNSEKTFFIETLMVWIHHFRMLEGHRETFKHCIIIEEAHNIVSASTKETVIDILLREIRELGEAIVLVDQHPSQMSVPAIGNTYTTIALNAKHSKDLACLGDIMQVPRESRELFSQLPMGRAVVKLQSRYTRPFQIQIPKVALDKGSVTDTDLLQMYSPGDYADSPPEPAGPCPDKEREAVPPARKEEDGVDAESPSRLEHLLLKDILDHPLDGVVKRYNRLGVSRRRGNHAKEALMARGLVNAVSVPTKTGKVVLLEPTTTARDVLKSAGFCLASPREGGLVHAFWKETIGQDLRNQSWAVTEEKAIGKGQAVDIEARKSGVRVAIEVEAGSRGCENILRLLQHGFDWIVSFSADESIQGRTHRDMADRHVSVNNVIFAGPVDYEDKIRFLTTQADEGSSPAPKRI
jgi:hypothetical protein